MTKPGHIIVDQVARGGQLLLGSGDGGVGGGGQLLLESGDGGGAAPVLFKSHYFVIKGNYVSLITH